jgi:hypothetical protein
MLENTPDQSSLSRVQLVELAESLHVSDPDVMTRAELEAAIREARRPSSAPPERQVTWVSVARRLLASIVEQGLNLPDAAALIRGDAQLNSPPKAPPPVATITLARIYAAQGHVARAVATLDEVLRSDPDHDLARTLREQLEARLAQERVHTEPREPAAPETPASDGGATDSVDADSVDADSVASDSVAAAPADVAGAATPTDAKPVAQCAAEAELPAAEALPTAPTVEHPHLVLLETGASSSAREAYLYWEFGGSAASASARVVSHSPALSGAKRQERWFDLNGQQGALKLDGVPRGAVLRAMLASPRGHSATPLAVAGCVIAPAPGAGLELCFSPYDSATPMEVAGRAIDQLASARAVAW